MSSHDVNAEYILTKVHRRTMVDLLVGAGYQVYLVVIDRGHAEPLKTWDLKIFMNSSPVGKLD